MRAASHPSIGWLLVLTLALGARASGGEQSLGLQHFVVPEYPMRARLAGAEGTIVAPIVFDSHCGWKGGPRHADAYWLQDAVSDTILANLRFSDCKPGSAVNLVVRFVLVGDPTNGWAPTHVRQTGPYSFEISTRPADLSEFGLQRIPKNSQKMGLEEKTEQVDGSGFAVATLLPIPSYPPLARQAAIQGEVKATADVDADCHISNFHGDGNPYLVPAVKQAFGELAFPGCKTNPKTLGGTFKFVLNDFKTNDWTPTQFEYSAPDTFVISTSRVDYRSGY